MAEIETLSEVALLDDVPAEGLRRGQVGTVVEDLAPGVYEVEFSDDGDSFVRQEASEPVVSPNCGGMRRNGTCVVDGNPSSWI
jgi:hypothetical protein